MANQVLFIQGGWSSEDIEPIPDLGTRLQESWRIYLYHGSDDDTAPFGHVDLYEKAIPQAVVCRLAGRNHQLNDDMSEVAADIRRLTSLKPYSVREEGKYVGYN